LKVVLEGFDLATGHTRWSFDAGADADLATEAKLPPRTADTVIVLPGPDGKPTAVDLSTGISHAAAAATTAWCQSEVDYTVTSSQTGGGTGSSTYIGQDALFPCDLATHQIATPRRIPTFVGTPISGLVAWSEPHRVVAAPQG